MQIKTEWHGLDRTLGGFAITPGFHAQVVSENPLGFTAFIVTNRLHHHVIQNLGKEGITSAIQMRFEQYRRSSLPIEFPMPSFWDFCTRIGNENRWAGDEVGTFGKTWLKQGAEGVFRKRTVRDWIYSTKFMRDPWAARS